MVNNKLAMIMYITFAVLSFLFGIKMFQFGETLRGVLFMVAVACWGMCIYNTSIYKRQENQSGVTTSIKKAKFKK